MHHTPHNETHSAKRPPQWMGLVSQIGFRLRTISAPLVDDVHRTSYGRRTWEKIGIRLSCEVDAIHGPFLLTFWIQVAVLTGIRAVKDIRIAVWERGPLFLRHGLSYALPSIQRRQILGSRLPQDLVHIRRSFTGFGLGLGDRQIRVVHLLDGIPCDIWIVREGS